MIQVYVATTDAVVVLFSLHAVHEGVAVVVYAISAVLDWQVSVHVPVPASAIGSRAVISRATARNVVELILT
jgi:hypothetical protein